jgi:hypothetical protein
MLMTETSAWWCPAAQRYRYSLPLRFFYQWTWPITLWIMHRLPPETAHHAAIRGIHFVRTVDACWRMIVTGLTLVALIPLLLLCRLLPRWFYLKKTRPGRP